MKEVIIEYTVSTMDNSRSYIAVEDCSDMFDEWMENGNREDVLSSIREGTFNVASLSKDEIAFGYIESLVQSDDCPPFLRDSYPNLTISVVCKKNDYLT